MSAAPTKVCENCGAKIAAGAEVCPKCGVDVGPDKGVSIPVVASAIFPGLGQIYNKQLVKGIVFIVGGVFLLYLIFGFSHTALLEVGLLFYTLLWLYNVYDALNVARKAEASAA